MYIRLYTFLEKSTYLPFPNWFQAKTNFSHSCINRLNTKQLENLKKLVRKQLNDSIYGCGTFVDF